MEEANYGSKNMIYGKALYENVRPYRNIGAIEVTLQVLGSPE